MPGIYVNDGGATANSLGDILGGIANELSPAGRARALLLNEQTESADRSNWLKSAVQRGVLDVPGALGVMQADPGGGGGVAGTVASMAQPPGSDPMAPGARDPTRNASPLAGVIAGSFANNPDMSNFQTGVNLGRTANLGPGHDYATETEVAKQNMSPFNLGDTESRHFPRPDLGLGGGGPTGASGGRGGAPGSGGGYKTGDAGGTGAGGGLPGEKVVVGGDPAARQADIGGRAANLADAVSRSKLSEAAAQQINENDRLLAVYNKLVNAEGTDDTAGVLGDQIFKDLATIPGIGDITKLSSRLGAMEAIQARLGTSINAQLQSVQAGAPVRGLLQSITPPDPSKLDPEQFRSAMAQYRRVLKYQLDEGPIADAFRKSKYSKEDNDAYISALEAHKNAEFKNQQDENAGAGDGKSAPAPAPAAGAGGAPTAAPAPTGPLQRASKDDVAEAQAGMRQIPKGFTGPQWRQRIIDHAKKARNIDLEAGGF